MNYRQMKEEEIELCAELLADSYIQNYAIWNKLCSERERLIACMKSKIIYSFHKDLNYVFEQNSKIIGCTVASELADHIKCSEDQNEYSISPEIKPIGDFLSFLEHKIYSEMNLEEGYSIYGDMIGILKESSGRKQGLVLQYQFFMKMKSKGYKKCYLSIISPFFNTMLEAKKPYVVAKAYTLIKIKDLDVNYHLVEFDLEKLPSFQDYSLLFKKTPRPQL